MRIPLREGATDTAPSSGRAGGAPSGAAPSGGGWRSSAWLAGALPLAAGALLAGLRRWQRSTPHAPERGSVSIALQIAALLVILGLFGVGLSLAKRRQRRAMPIGRGTPGALAFPHLDQLMGAWFHQDFDVEGDTVAEIVDGYRAVTARVDRAALQAEIAAFIAAHPDDLDAAFAAAFRPDISPAAFSGSTLAFLLDIQTELAR